MVQSAYNASSYSSATLGVTATSSSFIYVRDVSNVLDASLENAAALGTLTTNETQLSVKGTVSKANTTHYYSFNLNGDEMKLDFVNNTGSSGIRLQVMNADGKVIADSSSTASAALRTAYNKVTSSGGLQDMEAGTYHLKVSFDATAMRSADQTYSIGLYSGTSFRAAYQSSATAQTKYSETVLTDNTMTYSLIDALEYSTQATHRANASFDEAVNIGWLFEDKSALSVKGQMTWVCDEQYYSLTLQQGENLKMALNNTTNTSKLRVQVYDSTGSFLYADSEGTDEQVAAYDDLISSKGMEAKAGNYTLKLSYATGEAKKDQTYSFKLYSGSSYEKLYETKTATETAATAILSGSLTQYADARTVSANYLASSLGEDMDDIFSVLKQYSAYI